MIERKLSCFVIGTYKKYTIDYMQQKMTGFVEFFFSAKLDEVHKYGSYYVMKHRAGKLWSAYVVAKMGISRD